MGFIWPNTCHNFGDCNVMAAEMWVTMSMTERFSAVSGSKVTERRSTIRGHIVNINIGILFCRCGVSFRRCAVSSVEVAKNMVQNLMFLRLKFGKRAPPKFFEEFVNGHHVQPTGQVWLKSHGWFFVYADEIKNKLQR